MSDYVISNKDIDAVVRYLKIFHPENANRDFARYMLESSKSAIHKIASENPDDIEAIYEQVEASNKKSSKDN
jgi:hypothetical protein